MKKFIASALAGLFILTAAPQMYAATLAVDWGGAYVTADQAFSSAGGFTSGNPDLISPATGYSGTSSTFHGQVQIFAGTPALATSVVNNGGSDRIQLKAADTPGAQNVGFLLLWQQADFLNGLNTGTVGLDSTSAISLNIFTYASQTADSGRLVLRLGSDYYISNRIYTGTGTTTTSDPTALTYYAYDPINAMNVNSPTTPVSIVSGGLISGVTEVGFYFESSATANAVRIQDIEINMVAVPEPSAYALLGLGLGALCLFHRRSLS